MRVGEATPAPCVTCGRTKETGCLCKPSRTARAKQKDRTRVLRAGHERAEKGKAKRRDRGCRFPLCGCRRLGLLVKARREVSHDKHKGMGGNPIGDRSTAAIMVELCNHRHQDGVISRHKGTLRSRFLDDDLGYFGPIEWYIEAETLMKINPRLGVMTLPFRTWATDGWMGVCVARETAVGQVGLLASWQREVLEQLARMEL